MLNNLTNFFNLISNRKIKTTTDPSDLITLGTRDTRYAGCYQPTAITAEDFINEVVSCVPAPPLPTPPIVVLGTGANSTVRCGVSNNAAGACSTVFGQCNTVNGCQASILGGTANTITSAGSASTIINGNNNTVSNSFASIQNGIFNTASGSGSIINGLRSLVSGSYSTTSNGNCNTISGGYSTISNGYCNTISGNCSVISNGVCNKITAGSSFIANGLRSCVTNNNSVIIGAQVSCNNGRNAFIGTGYGNKICSSPTQFFSCYGIIVGGNQNTLSSDNNGALVGGTNNLVAVTNGFVGGGNYNKLNHTTSDRCASGAVIVGGLGNGTRGGTWSNSYSGYFTVPPFTCNAGYATFVGGGFQNVATGDSAAVVGGRCNTASCACSFIMGSNITSDRACTTFVNNLSIKNIPTSSAGLPSGSVWSNAGVLTIVP